MAHEPTEEVPSLQIVAGPGAGTFIAVGDEPVVIGRAEEGVGNLADDPELSRRHALVTRTSDGSLLIADLGSTNGTFVNGNRMRGPHPIGPGDAVWVGSTTLQVVDVAGEPGMKRVARIARTPGGLQRIPEEIVRVLDQRAPVPFAWVAQVALFGAVIAVALNLAILTLAQEVFDVPPDGPHDPLRVSVETVVICLLNSTGFYTNFRRRTAHSMIRYLSPTAILPTAIIAYSLMTLPESNVASVLTAIVVIALPLAIVVPRLLALPSRARALPPPPEAQAASTHKEAQVA